MNTLYYTPLCYYVLEVVHCLNPVLSLNDGGGQIYLILLEIVLTPNLRLEQLLASLSFSPTFLLCTVTAFCQFLWSTHFLCPFDYKI